MPQRLKPPFRGDHVGSLIRPASLIAAREEAESGGDRAALERIQQQAIRDVVAMQEDIGLKLVTDGEYNRGAWHRDFLLRFTNVKLIPSRISVQFHSAEGTREQAPPSWQITGKLARPKPIFVEDFRYLASIAKATPKITIPSHRDAFPRRTRRDRHHGLSGHGGLLCRSGGRLPRGDR